MAIAIGLGLLVLTVIAIIGAYSGAGKDQSAARFWGIFLGGGLLGLLLIMLLK